MEMDTMDVKVKRYQGATE